MVVVVVGNQTCYQRWQLPRKQAGLTVSTIDPTHPAGKHRIDQYCPTADLEEKGSMTDPGKTGAV